MSDGRIEAFERLLKRGQDSALLRYSLGNEYLQRKEISNAITHLAHAVEMNPDYSAAWKLYGQVLALHGCVEEARGAYGRGIEAAVRCGDKQAEREMCVFLKRLGKKL
ncbi:MAG: tetratricopeptide repeat protein [Candidatus Eutrophobiaceae bacterium]